MLSETNSMTFKTRGPLTDEDALLYVERPTDGELTALVQQIDYVALIGARSCGKTSMLMRLHAQLRSRPRYALCYINLSLYSTLDEPRWYEAVYQALVESSGGLLPSDEGPFFDAIDFRQAIVGHLRAHLPSQIMIVLLDDVETVPPEISTAFFATLREMYVSRGIEPAFRRLCFVLAGSYIPDELIPDPTISPFRVAEKIYIEDVQDITPITQWLDREGRPMAGDVPARIYEWTEGDLYLTQKLCKRLDERHTTGQLTPSHVDQIVERYMMDDDLFLGLEKKLTTAPRLLELIYSIVLRETTLRFTRTNRAMAQAWLMGGIKANTYGNCIARNAIYENVLREVLKAIPLPTKPTGQSRTTQTAEPLQGRYVMEQVIKRGLLNHIYKGRDLETGQVVAIKQLLPTRGGDVIAWRRFQREAETLRRLDHPNIVGLIDSFRTGDYNYIIMEHVGGGTLDSLLSREGRQPIPLIMDILLPVADALAYVHEQNIVHRDLKPSNILLTPELKPRLADFGVAHFLANAERITETYAIVGTPAYLSPEAYNNSIATPAEDIWSMGVTLYELLTGVLPFTGRTQDHVRHAVQHAPMPNLHQIRPDVPDVLADLVNRMMHRDPNQRLPNGEALLQALMDVHTQLNGD